MLVISAHAADFAPGEAIGVPPEAYMRVFPQVTDRLN
jgi:hypothetical protein